LIELRDRSHVEVNSLRDALAAAFDVGRMIQTLDDEVSATCRSAFDDLLRALSDMGSRLYTIRKNRTLGLESRTSDLLCGLERLNGCALAEIRGFLCSRPNRAPGFADVGSMLELAPTTTIRTAAPRLHPHPSRAPIPRVHSTTIAANGSMMDSYHPFYVAACRKMLRTLSSAVGKRGG
jgi:hypothetical protein